MTIVIPLSGIGQRFIDEGYSDFKPLIKVNNKPIIQYVIELFPTENNFIFIVTDFHITTTNIKATIISLVPNAVFKIIEPHKLGPSYAVQQAFDLIDDAEQVIVNYCDFSMLWDYLDFKKQVTASNCDGAIPSYIGFHPHLIHQHNVYAGCKVDTQNNLLAIEEKFSFTENKFDSHHSVGTYYFKNGALLKKYIQLQIENKISLNGEYYCSLIYPLMLKAGLHIKVYDAITHFCQWGTPFDLKEFEYWYQIIENYNQPQLQFEDNTTILMPMAGNGQRFVDAGFAITKPLLPVNQQPMFLAALSFLPKANANVFITKNKLDNNILPTNAKQILIENTTQGQACTALLAKNEIELNQPVLISPCDNGMLYEQQQFLAQTKTADVVVFGFKNYQAVSTKPQQYGWIKLKDTNTIVAISCKTPISNNPINDYAITGAFWFKKANMFTTAVEQMIAANDTINNEFYLDVAINYCIANGLKVQLFAIDYYICWGTPNDYNTFNYWQAYNNLLQQ